MARMPLAVSDADILDALAGRRAVGGAALFDRYQKTVRRVLVRVMGTSAEIDDLVQETFMTAIRTIDRVREAASLRAWLTSVAVFTARDEIRRQSRRRFFHLRVQSDLHDLDASFPTPEIKEALRATYEILGKLPANDRIAFALRFIEGMELTEVAIACRVSLATIKRRLGRGRRRFEDLARRRGVLEDWMDRGAAQ